jgi:hypothetical protein
MHDKTVKTLNNNVANFLQKKNKQNHNAGLYR